jgi:hypothetical protein
MAASIPPSDQTGIGGPTPWPANPGNVLKTAEDKIDKPVVNGSKNTNPVINEGNGTSQINGTKNLELVLLLKWLDQPQRYARKELIQPEKWTQKKHSTTELVKHPIK